MLDQYIFAGVGLAAISIVLLVLFWALVSVFTANWRQQAIAVFVVALVVATVRYQSVVDMAGRLNIEPKSFGNVFLSALLIHAMIGGAVKFAVDRRRRK